MHVVAFFFFFFNSTAESQMCPPICGLFFEEFLIYHPLDVITLDVSMLKSSCFKGLSGEDTCCNSAHQRRWGSADVSDSLATSDKSLMFSSVFIRHQVVSSSLLLHGLQHTRLS